MIEIKYYDENCKELAREVLNTGKIKTELLALTCKKCLLQGYYKYTARDHVGNHIEEVVLKDELVFE